MIKLKDGVAAVRDALSSGVNKAAETNTHVALASDSEPPKRAEGEYDGPMPGSNALVSDRSRVLKDIAARRDAQIVENAEEGNKVYAGTAGEEEETLPPNPEINGEDIPVDGEPAAPAVEAPPAAPAAPEEMRTLIVDGKQIQVPVSKIMERGTAAFQKETAAEVRLAEASRLLEQAQRIAAQPHAPKEPVAPAFDLSPIAKLTPEERVRIIRYGTDEEAGAVQKYMEEQASRPQVKVEEIVRAAQQAVAPQIAFEKGKDYVIAEYGDLLQDPDLGAIFLNRENAARAAGDTRSHQELYKAIGEDMRVKFARPKPGSTGAAKPTLAPNASTAPVRTMEEKQAAKAAAPSLPRLASARLDGDANTPRPPTRAEMFAGMRRARGFQQGKDL